MKKVVRTARCEYEEVYTLEITPEFVNEMVKNIKNWLYKDWTEVFRNEKVEIKILIPEDQFPELTAENVGAFISGEYDYENDGDPNNFYNIDILSRTCIIKNNSKPDFENTYTMNLGCQIEDYINEAVWNSDRFDLNYVDTCDSYDEYEDI